MNGTIWWPMYGINTCATYVSRKVCKITQLVTVNKTCFKVENKLFVQHAIGLLMLCNK